MERIKTQKPSGVITRRRVLATSAAALGGAGVAAGPWRIALGQAKKPFRIGTEQPLTGVAALGGKTAVIGLQMAVDRINRGGGILGRQVELIVADDESKPDTGRRAVEKLVTEDEIDVHVGGYLSNICLACVPVFVEHNVVNMITVCLDTTLTTSKCNRYTFRPFDFAPAQAVAFAPYLVNKMGKKWQIAYADYSWGQSTKDAYAAEIKKSGGEVTGTIGIPLGTADMTPFLSKISGDFDGLFLIFFGPDAIRVITQGYDLGLSKKYKFAGDGAIAVSARRHRPLCAGVRPAARYAASSRLPGRGGRSLQEGRTFRCAARPLCPVEFRGDERRQGRDREIRLPGPRRQRQIDRRPRRARDEGERRLSAGRQGAAQGGPSGVRARDHL